MVKIREGVSLKPPGDLYVRREFKKLPDYEGHLERMAEAEEYFKKNEDAPTRSFTQAELSVRAAFGDKIEKLYRALDDAVEIVPDDSKSSMRNKIRAKLVNNEEPLYFERDEELFLECLERAKLLALAYIREDARESIIDEE